MASAKNKITAASAYRGHFRRGDFSSVSGFIFSESIFCNILPAFRRLATNLDKGNFVQRIQGRTCEREAAVPSEWADPCRLCCDRPNNSGLRNVPKFERDTIIPNFNIGRHFEGIRQLKVMFMANDKTLHRLPVCAKIFLYPSHVAKNLPHNLVRRTTLFEFNYNKGF